MAKIFNRMIRRAKSIGSAIVSTPMSRLKFQKITAAQAEIQKLAAQCAELGSPQEVYTGLYITAANNEIERLQGIVAKLKAPAPEPVTIISAPPSVETKANSASPVAKQSRGGAEAFLSDESRRYIAMHALNELGVSIDGTESAIELESKLSAEQARIASESKKLDDAIREAKTRVASAPVSGTRSDADIAAIHTMIFGAQADAEDAGPMNFEVGKGTITHRLHKQAHGVREAAAIRGEMTAAARKRHIEAASPQAQQQLRNKRLQRFCNHGLKIPGVSFAGFSVPENHYDDFGPERRRVAQNRINEFCSVLDGDETACMSTNAGAQAARAHVSSVTGKPYAIGMRAKTETLAERDARRFPNSNIPRSGY